MDIFEKLSCIGEGAFGKVWKCRYKDSERLVAIKEFMGGKMKDNVSRELVPLTILSHDNLLKAVGWFVESGKLYGIFELLDHSIVDELKGRDRGFDSDVLRKYTFQILQGAHFLHRKNIIHRDIKPDNILVSRSGVVKLADLGFSRKVEATSVHLTSWAGTPYYMAPELLLGETKYSTPVDVWAIGCTILVMAKRRMVFRGTPYLALVRDIVAKVGPLTQRQQCRYLAQCKTKELPVVQFLLKPTEKYQVPDEQLAGLIEACFQMDPANRSSCSELLGQDYFTWDHFPNRFTKEMELMVQRDRKECCVLWKPQPQASGHSGKTDTQPASTPPDNSTHSSQTVNVVEVVTPSSQLQDGSHGMENLEEAQDKPPQTRGNEEPAKEVKKKKKKKKRSFKAVLQRAVNAIRRCFTSRVSPM